MKGIVVGFLIDRLGAGKQQEAHDRLRHPVKCIENLEGNDAMMWG
jgi:hypothetical protein